VLDSPLPTSATGAVHLSNGSRHGGVRVLHAAGWAHSGITRHGTPTSPAMRRGEVGRMTVHDEREHQSAYVTSGGRRFRALYNPNVTAPRWFVRSFVVDPDGAPGDIRDYPERYYKEEDAWSGAWRAADAAVRA